MCGVSQPPLIGSEVFSAEGLFATVTLVKSHDWENVDVGGNLLFVSLSGRVVELPS